MLCTKKGVYWINHKAQLSDLLIQINHEAKLSDLWDVKLGSEGFKVIIPWVKVIFSFPFQTFHTQIQILHIIAKERWNNYNKNMRQFGVAHEIQNPLLPGIWKK